MKRKTKKAIIPLLLALLLLLSSCGEKPVMAVPTTDSGSVETTRPETSPTPEVSPTPETSPAPLDGETGTSHPLMWEVRAKSGRGHIYLFGSMHVADEELYPLPDAVEDAFAECETLAVEFDTTYLEQDISAQLEMVNSMLLTDGKTIHDIMDDELYEKVKNFIIDSGTMYSELYDMYNPYFWSSLVDEVLLSRSGLISDYGVDTHFLNAAHERNMEILDIESMAFQLDILNSVPNELQLALIEQSIDSADHYNEDLYELYDAYRFGSEDKIAELAILEADEEALVNYTKQEAELLLSQIEEYNAALLTNRNIGMAEAAKGYLKSGKDVFLVVGVAHMVGDEGIVSLLRNAGYEVAQVIY